MYEVGEVKNNVTGDVIYCRDQSASVTYYNSFSISGDYKHLNTKEFCLANEMS